MSAGPSSEVYCLDADVLINIKNHYPEALKKVSRCAKEGKVVISEGVCREICEGSDRLKPMVQNWQSKYGAVVQLSAPILRAEHVRIELAYGEVIQIGKQQRRGFWRSKGGKRSADSQVVAVSKVNGYITVSNDKVVECACQLENVPCIGWHEFFRRMKQGFTGQGLLPGVE